MAGDRHALLPRLFGNRTLQFKGLEYLTRWVIPNAFFHATTTYAILRHNGVDLGKTDFLTGSGPGFSQSA